MGPEKVENVDFLTFKKAKNQKFALRKLLAKYGFGHKMSLETHAKLKFGYFVHICARIRMGPEKVENIDAITFKKRPERKKRFTFIILK